MLAPGPGPPAGPGERSARATVMSTGILQGDLASSLPVCAQTSRSSTPKSRLRLHHRRPTPGESSRASIRKQGDSDDRDGAMQCQCMESNHEVLLVVDTRQGS